MATFFVRLSAPKRHLIYSQIPDGDLIHKSTAKPEDTSILDSVRERNGLTVVVVGGDVKRHASAIHPALLATVNHRLR